MKLPEFKRINIAQYTLYILVISQEDIKKRNSKKKIEQKEKRLLKWHLSRVRKHSVVVLMGQNVKHKEPSFIQSWWRRSGLSHLKKKILKSGDLSQRKNKQGASLYLSLQWAVCNKVRGIDPEIIKSKNGFEKVLILLDEVYLNDNSTRA